MKHSKFYLAVIAALFAFTFTNAQTVDEVIAKHVDAIGGRAKLDEVKSVYIEGSMDVMGNQAPVAISILNGKGVKTESEMMGNKVTQVYTDKGGWAINPMMGSSAATPMPDEQFKAGEDQVFFSGPLANYEKTGGKAELLGQEKVGDANAYKIKFTNKDGGETTFYIDATTYYLVQSATKINMMGQEIELVSIFSDFKKTDSGLTYAYMVDANFGSQFSMTTTIKSIEINKQIDPAIFEMPK